MSTDTRAGRKSGLPAGLRTAGILLLLAGLVFGVTVIASYTGGFQAPTSEDPTDETAAITGPPLEFVLTEVSYNPAAEDQIIRAYPGFFEVSPELNYQSFWFRQPHPREVRVAVKGRSCSACTSARVGMLPANPLAKYVDQVKAGQMPPPIGPAETLTASLLAAGVTVNSQVQWQELDFDHPEKFVTLPAAGSEAPLTGLVQMIYKVTVLGPKTLDAYLELAVSGGPPAPMKLSVASAGIPAFRTIPADGKVVLGDMPENMAPRSFEIVCWSATRRLTGTGHTLPPPSVAVVPRDPFIVVGSPVPVPESDLGRVAVSLEVDKVQPPVYGAYRIPVTVHRRKPANAPADAPPEPDVGPWERQIALTVPGEQSAQTITLTGTVTGLVALTDAKLIDLGSFPSQTGCPERAFNLASDRPGLKLSISAAESKPKYVTLKLSEPTDTGGRRTWKLTASVPANACLEEFPSDSIVVLTADTGDGVPRRVKVPLKGRAFSRGGR